MPLQTVINPAATIPRSGPV